MCTTIHEWMDTRLPIRLRNRLIAVCICFLAFRRKWMGGKLRTRIVTYRRFVTQPRRSLCYASSITLRHGAVGVQCIPSIYYMLKQMLHKTLYHCGSLVLRNHPFHLFTQVEHRKKKYIDTTSRMADHFSLSCTHILVDRFSMKRMTIKITEKLN